MKEKENARNKQRIAAAVEAQRQLQFLYKKNPDQKYGIESKSDALGIYTFTVFVLSELANNSVEPK